MNTQNDSVRKHFWIRRSREVLLSLAVISATLAFEKDNRWMGEAVSLIVLTVLIHVYAFQKRGGRWLFWAIVATLIPVYMIGIPLSVEAFSAKHLSTLEFVLLSITSMTLVVTLGALVAVMIWAQTKEAFPEFTARLEHWRARQ